MFQGNIDILVQNYFHKSKVCVTDNSAVSAVKMAENQQGRQRKSTLRQIPGWELHSPGSPVSAASTVRPAASRPADRPATQPRTDSHRHQHMHITPEPTPAPEASENRWANFKLSNLFRNASWPSLPALPSLPNLSGRAKLALSGAAVATAAAMLFAFTSLIKTPANPDDAAQNEASTPVMGTGPSYTHPPQAYEVPPAAEAPAHTARARKPSRRERMEVELPATDLAGMISPLEAYELTDYKPSRGFGRLFHPIRKKMKHHDGVDFKAPHGTPVYAVSDGIIEQNGWEDGYGNTVRLAHSGATQSLYAHLSKFAKGVRPGTRIKQGDLIGYVGATGWATGPHLHFEIRKNDKPVDPLKVAKSAAAVPTPAIGSAFSQASSSSTTNVSPDRINALINESSAREGLHPHLLPQLFGKEVGRNKSGQFNLMSVSDKGAAGLCQFTEQTFLIDMKQHGYRLGFAQYADQIKAIEGANRTIYTAGDNESQILKLRFDPSIAIPLCAAHVKTDLTYLKGLIGRTPNFADSSLAHYTGAAIAKDLIRAAADPKARKDPAYIYAERVNYSGGTNMNVFFEDGKRNKPYTVEEVYNSKMRIMGNTPALVPPGMHVAQTGFAPKP